MSEGPPRSGSIKDPREIATDISENADAGYIEVALAHIILDLFARLDELSMGMVENSTLLLSHMERLKQIEQRLAKGNGNTPSALPS